MDLEWYQTINARIGIQKISIPVEELVIGFERSLSRGEASKSNQTNTLIRGAFSTLQGYPEAQAASKMSRFLEKNNSFLIRKRNQKARFHSTNGSAPAVVHIIFII